MVVRIGGCYRAGFKGFRGVAQVYPLSPTIFNVVVDSVVRHWESLVTEGSGGDRSDDNAAQPARRTTRARENEQRQTEEGHTQLNVKAYFSTWTTVW